MSDNLPTDGRTLGRCLCIITGASKGFGRALAFEVSHHFQPGSVLLLVARSETLLEEVREEIRSGAGDLVVHCISADLSTREAVDRTVTLAKHESSREVDHVLLVNNAASVGRISKVATLSDMDQLNSYFALNASSPLALTAGLLQAFPPRAGLRWTLVNCSSVFALQGLQSFGLYCTGKAAREMMFKVLSKEEADVKVLNYSPGPMDTDMQTEIRTATGFQHQLLPCQDSAAKLLKLLLDNDFSSGVLLDFFDIENK
ncbi:sepiapterin reductase b [Neosynchiropus ocellatus]